MKRKCFAGMLMLTVMVSACSKDKDNNDGDMERYTPAFQGQALI